MGRAGYRTVAAFAALLTLMTLSAALPAAAAAGSNPIVLENQQTGTSAWNMNHLSGAIATDAGGQIKGYAGAVSVNKGQSITFYVSVAPAQTYTIDVYRIGWYQGLGGRLMQHIGPLNGTAQPTCPTDSTTGEIACNWAPAYTLATQTTWTSGVYEAILTNAANYHNAIIFVVRDDSRTAALLYQQPVNTYQAYNGYPANGKTGKSLYEFNSYGAKTVTGTTRAAKVSFDRPYEGAGYGDFEEWEINFVRWMEKSGYDVTYSTDVDTDTNGASLLNYRGFLSVGHNEYWSKNMYNAAINALAGGVNLGFFGANAIYWQVRYEPSASGVPDRVLVCYKDASIDPTTDPSTTTVQWGNPILNRPEQSLIGVMYENQTQNFETYLPYVVTNASDWIYAGTGFKNGDSVPGLVGYEADQQSSSYPFPNAVAGTYLTVSNSPFTNIEGGPDHANSSIYQAPSGAWVFGAGTIGWSFGLDNFVEHSAVDPRIQQTTANILNQFSKPPPPTVVTGAASAVTQTSASLNAMVNPNGGEVSECKLEYGTTTSYGSTAPCASSPGSGTSPVAVSASVGSLTANTTYHFRISATNPGGTSKGSDQTFKTPPNPPTVVTGSASSVTQTSATLNATVNPEGGTVSDCHFEYGTSEGYGSSAPCTSLPGSGETPVAVSASLGSLTANTTYHFRISATNPGGTSKGSDQTFKTPPNPATVVTEPASSVTQTSATLNATVNPEGGTVSDCHFEYGTSEGYGSTAPCASSPGSGTSPVAVSASVGSLTANTTYHFRISATNPGGTSKGSDQTFKTPPNPPTVVTEPASSVSQTSATLNATVNPNGGTVSDCHFEYGTSEGYGSTAPCTSLPGSGETPVAVSASVTGLSANTTYHFRISATNPGGTSKGSDQTFKTPPNPPTVVTGSASAVTQTGATLNATVNPEGGTVSDCHFEYGTSESYGSTMSCASLPGSGTTPVAVSSSVAGLTPKITYHFRISATNPGGTSKGSDQTFTTLTAPHYYRDAVLVGPEPVVVVGWGTLAVKTVVGGSGEVGCRTAEAGTVENPVGGGPAVGASELFATYRCEQVGICPAGTTVIVAAETLPWPTILEAEESLIRVKATSFKVNIDCRKEGKSEGGETFVGGDQPSFHHGTSALHPGFLEFDAGAGTLEKEGSSGSVLGKIEGEVRILGYEEQELIDVKSS